MRSMRTKDSIWLLRACVLMVLLIGASCWFDGARITGLQIAYWVLLALPWLVALFLPSERVDISAGLVVGGAITIIPVLRLLTMLASWSQTTPSSSLFFMLLFMMAFTAVLGAVFSFNAFGWRQATAAILVFCSALYEVAVLEARKPLEHFQTDTSAQPLTALYEIQSCIVRFKLAHSEYPDSINGILNQGKCVEKKLLRALMYFSGLLFFAFAQTNGSAM
jgi:hypothetical protein